MSEHSGIRTGRQDAVLAQVRRVAAVRERWGDGGGVRAYHVRYFFPDPPEIVREMELPTIDRVLRQLEKRGLIRRVRPAEYLP